MSINRGMDKEDVVCIHNGILLSHKYYSATNDEPRDLHTEWSRSGRERQIPYDITYMWNLKKKKKKDMKEKQTHREWTYGYRGWGGRAGEGIVREFAINMYTLLYWKQRRRKRSTEQRVFPGGSVTPLGGTCVFGRESDDLSSLDDLFPGPQAEWLLDPSMVCQSLGDLSTLQMSLATGVMDRRGTDPQENRLGSDGPEHY